MIKEKRWIGLDVGSVSINFVLMNDKGDVLEERYIRHNRETVPQVIRLLKNKVKKGINIAITGSGGTLIAEILGIEPVNEVIAQAKGISHFYPRIRTVIEIGGEDSKLILLDYDDSLKECVIKDFALNTICAAGTGSFLDQQASRLGLTIEEFGLYALKSEHCPRIAGRCSVFAKTDMIHLQQQATPDCDIVYGLCVAMARNFKVSIGKGKTMIKPVAFQGGVAANKGMIRAFEKVLEFEKSDMFVPKYFASLGAIGSLLISRKQGKENPLCIEGLKRLEEYVNSPRKRDSGLKSLTKSFQISYPSNIDSKLKSKEKIDAFLGVDVGSISTNVVVLDRVGNLLAKSYLMTAGRPIEAVRKGLDRVGKELGKKVNIRGVCTTGSGRYLTADFIGADLVKNEITTQARAAIEINKDVDTIFEIGGQDSKYISIADGRVVDFEMNKICAAGTGSFLEEQAEKLNINIKKEFGKTALSSRYPVRLGERCTVFMESDLTSHQQNGAAVEDLVAGLCYSIVLNYLNRVVGTKKVGNNIFFQGGVAFNEGVVAAFEKVTGKKITVPPNHEVTGAIGCALMARDNSNGESKFKGFDLSKKKYNIKSFECKGCPNCCEINQVNVEGEEPLFYGSRCEKYERRKKRKVTLPDLFAEREKLLFDSYHQSPVTNQQSAIKVGIPLVLIFHELLPFWSAFFYELGMEVIISDKTNRKVIQQGTENVASETCFPVKISHGHVLNLIEKSVDYIFIPSIINLPQDNPALKNSFACPYAQTLPYLISAALNPEERGVKILRPIIYFQEGRKGLEIPLIDMGKELGKGSSVVRKAITKAEEAQKKFYSRIKERGEEVLSSLKGDDKALVIVSRPYNGCDPGINLGLPQKLQELGVLAIPLDFLHLDRIDISEEWPNMYWRYGQKILSGAEIIREHPNLFALYLTNFGCGPDSFVTKYFNQKMSGKPFLMIEVDEHSADVGAITRCEAFIDSLKNYRKENIEEEKVKTLSISRSKKRTVFIPYICDQAFILRSAFNAFGIPSEVMPESDQETLDWGRKFTSGKECYPFIVTTGDMVKITKRKDFNPSNSAFFMPSGCGSCRFGQYNMLHRLILDDLGYKDVPIYAPNQDENIYSELKITGGGRFVLLTWKGCVAVDLLEKCRRQVRPYELNRGETETVYRKYFSDVCQAITEKRDILPILKRASRDFEAIKTSGIQKPVIGIVGEIFIRSHRFSNDNIISEIEKLGGEVWMPPFGEWLMYKSQVFVTRSKRRRNIIHYLINTIRKKIQHSSEEHLSKPFEKFLKNYPEPRMAQTLNYSMPYLHPSYEGEAVLSVGKTIDFSLNGLAGVINVMPFTCMPGTIVTAILKRVRKDYNNIPIMSIAYDGLEKTNTKTRLEAFMYQAQQYDMKYDRTNGSK